MKKRRQSREMALQMLYQSDLARTPGEQVVAAFDPSSVRDAMEIGADNPFAGVGPIPVKAVEYAQSLVRGTLANLDEIDRLIRQQADHWRLERMPAVDRNILRLAVYEFLYEQDVPKIVVMDEAIELAKTFGSEQSSSFVNGLLDGLLKQHEFPGRLS